MAAGKERLTAIFAVGTAHLQYVSVFAIIPSFVAGNYFSSLYFLFHLYLGSQNTELNQSLVLWTGLDFPRYQHRGLHSRAVVLGGAADL